MISALHGAAASRLMALAIPMMPPVVPSETHSRASGAIPCTT
eukprot:CAMPEP_0184677360 /NCGR_PEP_ID=MMETSP0308-20130426/88840_1 /TAXON_ID=38269 /ORGANISM="Gloeochaete witrockiana, Strain SAG 46.84" /LENGTH=41 /DNA_ID= /DNA_START= /DNA_END= /DNA_ORIENTATION=